MTGEGHFVIIVLLLATVSHLHGDRINHSKAACQNKIFDACVRSGCSCNMSHHHLTDFDLHERITWSELEMHCDSINKLEKFITSDKCMLFEPDHGLAEYAVTEEFWGKPPLEVEEVVQEQKNSRHGLYDPDSDIQRRSFLRFALTLNDRRITNLRTGCVDSKQYQCLNTGGKRDLNWVTRLEVAGKHLQSFGTSRDPILHLFPNLRVLRLLPHKIEFKMALVGLTWLQELHVDAHRSVVKLYCAFDGDRCLDNPGGLQKLKLRFAEARYSRKDPKKLSRMSGFELYGKLRLPKVIDHLVIDGKRNDDDVGDVGKNHKRSEIYELVDDDNDDDDVDVGKTLRTEFMKGTRHEFASKRNLANFQKKGFRAGHDLSTIASFRKNGFSGEHELLSKGKAIDIGFKKNKVVERELLSNRNLEKIGFKKNEVGENDDDDDDDDDFEEPTNKVKDGMFKSTEFNDVYISYRVYRYGQLTLDEFKSPRVKGQFKIGISQADIDTVLPKLYEMGIEDQMVVDLEHWDRKPFEAPFLSLKKSPGDEIDFSNCHYGQSMLQYLKVETKSFQTEPIIYVRGFTLKLSEIVKLAKKADMFAEAKRVKGFVYNLDYDIELDGGEEDGEDLIPGKSLELYFVQVGSTSNEAIAPGLKHGRISKKNFTMSSFNTEFYHIRNMKNPDAVFTRALATCLIVKIGELGKGSSTGKLLKNNEHLSRWYSILQQTRSFDRDIYTELEIARTESALKYLHQYVTWHENLNKPVSQIPLASLQSQSQSLQLLGETGRDLLKKSKELDTLESIDKLKQKTALKDTVTAITDTKIAILQASKAKSEALGNIELKRQKDLLKEIERNEATVDHFVQLFDGYVSNVESETKTFQAGSDFAGGIAKGKCCLIIILFTLSDKTKSDKIE